MKENSQHTPSLATRFLSWFINPEYSEDIMGDLEEEFREKATESVSKAKIWFHWQVFLLFRPSMIRKIKVQNSIEKEINMFKNYLKIAWRNAVKYKTGTIINIIGLSTGLAAFLLIALFVKDELSYDRHFSNAEDIYRVTVKNYDSDGAVSRQWAFASSGHAPRLKADYANIQYATRFMPWAFPDLTYNDKKFPAEQVVFADNDAFDVFDFNFILGSKEQAFEDMFSLVLTEESAIKIFGNDWEQQNVLNKTIILSRDGQQAPFKVTGVMENMPENQHFHFDYLAPIRFYEMIVGEQTMNNVGGNYNFMTYVRTTPGSNIKSLENQANDEFWDKYIGRTSSGRNASEIFDFAFQPLLDIHLHSDLEGEFEANGSIQQVTIFSIVGILLLLVACINYMNLATSHFSRRMKEVGVRKVIGAFRSSLIKQFLTEALLITLLSFPIAIGLVFWALPFLNDFMDKQISFNLLEEYSILLILLGLIMLAGIIAGSYPAIFLSRVNLVQALKGEQRINAGKWNFRSILVTFQYAVTIGLVFSLLVIESQLQFVKNTDPGYNKEQLLDVYISRQMENKNTFKKELINHPSIKSATLASRIPTGRLADSWGAAMYNGDSLAPSSFRLPFITVDESFLTTFEIELIAGENFNERQDMFEDSVGYYLINRKAAEAFGYTNPQEIIGKRLAYGSFNGNQAALGRIAGVTENFHFESMHSEIAPMVMLKTDGMARRIVLKIDPKYTQDVLQHVEKTWAAFVPGITVDYQFVDDRFERQYVQEERLSTMITVFTVVAVLIGCLGLIGMVGFIIETKVKEIGIRKVLGATSQNILQIVSMRFMILIGLAFVIVTPVSYYLMKGWLENFVYQTQISVLIFIVPLILTIIITMISTGYQTLRATLINPVECLKDE